MSERQGFDPSLESMAKKTGEATLHAGKEAFKPGGPTSNPIEHTVRKTGDVTLKAGKEIFKPVRNPIEKPEVDKSPEKKEQPQPSKQDVQGNDSGSGTTNQPSDSTQTQRDQTRRPHTRRERTNAGTQ